MIGAERTLSGSKYPEESPKALKPKHECEEVEVDAPAYHPYGFVY